MSILVEIAEKADVSVEGVIRVLTREPVSDAIKERVLGVLDDLTPEQTRAVQRFALAALHDVLLRPGEATEPAANPPAPDESLPALPVATGAEPQSEPEPDHLPSSGSDAALVQLSSVLGELAEAVRDLRRETDAERRERVDDLAVMIDLITTGWQGLDARLGRIERQVTRLESGRREQIAPARGPVPARVVPAAVEEGPAAPAAPPPPAAPADPSAAPAEPSTRDRLPVVAALTLVGAGIVTLAVLQLASGEPDLDRLVSSRENPATATEASSTTGARSTTAAPTTARTETRPPAKRPPVTRPPATTSRPRAVSPTAPTSTSEVLGTTSAGTTPAGTKRPKPPTVPADPQTMSAPPATTTRPPTATGAAFKPTRNWAWAPVEGADYYNVVFTWSGRTFYRASPTEPRLTLPGTVVFRPGAYRWVVRPGFGARTARNLGRPVVDSPFTVS